MKPHFWSSCAKSSCTCVSPGVALTNEIMGSLAKLTALLEHSSTQNEPAELFVFSAGTFVTYPSVEGYGA